MLLESHKSPVHPRRADRHGVAVRGDFTRTVFHFPLYFFLHLAGIVFPLFFLRGVARLWCAKRCAVVLRCDAIATLTLLRDATMKGNN